MNNVVGEKESVRLEGRTEGVEEVGGGNDDKDGQSRQKQLDGESAIEVGSGSTVLKYSRVRST